MSTVLKKNIEIKKKKVENIKDRAKNWSVIVSTKLHKVRTAQVMAIRKSFAGQIIVIVSKNRLTDRALKDTKLPNIDKFAEKVKGQNALMFTNINPFKLGLIFDKNKIDLSAKVGDIATGDIVIPAGNTGIPAGPVLSDFKEAKVKTRIDGGNIVVSEDSIVATTGDELSGKLAGLLSKLGLKPIKAGMELSSVYWEGLILEGDNVKINPDEYSKNISQAVQNSFVLATEIAYPVKEILEIVIPKIHQDAINLAIKINYVTDETLTKLIEKANISAINLNSLTSK
jgi:large subunit ribosomal protein L10